MACTATRCAVLPGSISSYESIFLLISFLHELPPAVTETADIPGVNDGKLSSGIRYLRQQPNRTGLHDVPDGVTSVNGDGVFLDRIALYNDVIYNVSERLLANRRSKKWQSPTSGERAIMVAGTSNDYLTKLASIYCMLFVCLTHK